GMSLLLWLLVRADESANPKLLWSAVGLVWLWSQLDSRAFLGWLLFLCLAVGESVRTGDGKRRALWGKAPLAGFGVTILHPFLWQAWLSPIRLFATDYPALQQIFPRPGSVELGFYPITFPKFWTAINHDSVAAIVLFVATVVSLVLNRERLHPGHLV